MTVDNEQGRATGWLLDWRLRECDYGKVGSTSSASAPSGKHQICITLDDLPVPAFAQGRHCDGRLSGPRIAGGNVRGPRPPERIVGGNTSTPIRRTPAGVKCEPVWGISRPVEEREPSTQRPPG